MKKLLLLISLFAFSCGGYEKLIEQELIKRNNGIDVKYKSKELKKENLSIARVKKMLSDSLAGFNAAFEKRDKNIDTKDIDLLSQIYGLHIIKYGSNDTYKEVINRLDSIKKHTTRDKLSDYSILYDYAFYEKKAIDDGLSSGWSFINTKYLTNVIDRLTMFVKYSAKLEKMEPSNKNCLTKISNRYKVYDHTVHADRHMRVTCYFDEQNNIVYFQSTSDVK